MGTDRLDVKTEILAKLEPQISDVIKFYNKRMDLKNKRFGYIEWGMITTQYIEQYNEHKEKYSEAVSAYNSLISSMLFKDAARGKKLALLPETDESQISEVNTNREKYGSPDKIFRMDKLEGSSSAGSY